MKLISSLTDQMNDLSKRLAKAKDKCVRRERACAHVFAHTCVHVYKDQKLARSWRGGAVLTRYVKKPLVSEGVLVQKFWPLSK